MSVPEGLLFRPPAYVENDIACDRMLFKKYFALFSDLGTAKTYMLIRDFVTHFQAGLVDCMVVIAPKSSVCQQWIEDEWYASTSMPRVASSWPDFPPMKPSPWPRVFTIYPAAFRRKTKQSTAVWNMVKKFMATGRCALIVDESQMLSAVRSKQSRRIRALAALSFYRRIASGNPAPTGLIKYYAQYSLLSPRILRLTTKSGFMERYCVMGGFKGEEIVGYKNEEDFYARTGPHTYHVKLEECHVRPGVKVKMPKKTWMTFDVELTPEQKRLITQVKKEFKAELESGEKVNLPMALQRITRIQQIACGFLPIVDDKGNHHGLRWIPENRTEALEDVMNTIRGKAIIWCNFRPALERLAVRFYEEGLIWQGGMSPAEEAQTKRAFISDPKKRWLFAQPYSAAEGLNGLTVAHYSLYWSNAHNAQLRTQSERRIWRTGQEWPCVYGDFIAKGTYDLKILNAVRNQQNVASNVLGGIADWLAA